MVRTQTATIASSARPRREGRNIKIHARIDNDGLPVQLVITPGQTHDIQAAAELLKTSVRAKCCALRQGRLHQTTPATLWVHGLVGQEQVKCNHILVMNGIGYCSEMRFRNFSDEE